MGLRRWRKRGQLFEGRLRPEQRFQASQLDSRLFGLLKQIWTQHPGDSRKACGAQGPLCNSEVLFPTRQFPSEGLSLSVPGSGAPKRDKREIVKERRGNMSDKGGDEEDGHEHERGQRRK